MRKRSTTPTAGLESQPISAAATARPSESLGPAESPGSQIGTGYSVLAGPVISYRTKSRVTPFAHALFGIDRTSLSGSTITGVSPSVPVTAAPTANYDFAAGAGRRGRFQSIPRSFRDSAGTGGLTSTPVLIRISFTEPISTVSCSKATRLTKSIFASPQESLPSSERGFYGNPNVYTALPAAIATYSFPSTAKAIGAA